MCKGLSKTDKFLIGQGITDGGKGVACLGESGMHIFDGTDWTF